MQVFGIQHKGSIIILSSPKGRPVPEARANLITETKLYSNCEHDGNPFYVHTIHFKLYVKH